MEHDRRTVTLKANVVPLWITIELQIQSTFLRLVISEFGKYRRFILRDCHAIHVKVEAAAGLTARSFRIISGSQPNYILWLGVGFLLMAHLQSLTWRIRLTFRRAGPPTAGRPRRGAR